MVKYTKPIDIVKKKKLEPSFEPSMNTLSCILKTMTDNDPGAKISLSRCKSQLR